MIVALLAEEKGETESVCVCVCVREREGGILVDFMSICFETVLN